MFCTKCGYQNAEGATFCSNCGSPLAPSAPQQQGGYAPQQQGGYSPQQQGGYVPFPQSPRPPRQRRPGLVVGLIVGGVVLLAGIVALVLWLTGVFDNGGVVGQWVNEDFGQVFTFEDNGDVELATSVGDFKGDYEFDKGKGEGVIEFDEGSFIDGKYEFMVDGNKMAIEDFGEFKRDKDTKSDDERPDKPVIGDDKPDRPDPDKPDDNGIKQGPLLGMWYAEDGYAGTIEYMPNGNCIVAAMGIEVEGTYTFSEASGKGDISYEFMGEVTNVEYNLDGRKLYCNGVYYVREYVEQKELSEIIEEIDDMG